MDFEDNNPQSEELFSSHPTETHANDGNLSTNMNFSTSQVTITDNLVQGKQRQYTEYTIRLTPSLTVRRRFSDFYSLYELLRKQFPCILVPPIPEKQGLSSIAQQITSSIDPDIVKLRKHALALFINRCIGINCIANSELFIKFLDPKVVWATILESSLANELKPDVLRLPPDGSQVTSLHMFLPLVPPPKQSPVKELSSFNASLEQHTKRLVSRYRKRATGYSDFSKELSNLGLDFTHADFGVVAEKTSSIVDQAHKNTMNLYNDLQDSVVCILAENVLLNATAKRIIQYKEQKRMQVDAIEKTLASLHEKVAHLETLPENRGSRRQQPPTTSNQKQSFWESAWGAVSGKSDPVRELVESRSFIQRYDAVLELAKRESEIAEETVNSEIQRYEELRKQEMEEASQKFLECNVQWAKRNLEVWKEAKRVLNE